MSRNGSLSEETKIVINPTLQSELQISRELMTAYVCSFFADPAQISIPDFIRAMQRIQSLIGQLLDINMNRFTPSIEHLSRIAESTEQKRTLASLYAEQLQFTSNILRVSEYFRNFAHAYLQLQQPQAQLAIVLVPVRQEVRTTVVIHRPTLANNSAGLSRSAARAHRRERRRRWLERKYNETSSKRPRR